MDSGAGHECKAAGGVDCGSTDRGVCAALPEVWGCHAPVSRRGAAADVLKRKRKWASGYTRGTNIMRRET